MPVGGSCLLFSGWRQEPLGVDSQVEPGNHSEAWELGLNGGGASCSGSQAEPGNQVY